MMKKDALMKELEGITLNDLQAEVIANKIIQRENDLMDEVEKPLKEAIKQQEFSHCLEDGAYETAIKESISIINSKRGGK